MSRRLLITLAAIVVIIVLGMVMIVKRSVPTHRKGDPNAEPPASAPAPKRS